MRELENGRLVRLLTKFGFINERPECVIVFALMCCIDLENTPRFDHDPRWAETGDRYIIKLFRDYVFHQVDESGRPVTDLSHVITALNKVRRFLVLRGRTEEADIDWLHSSTPAWTRRSCSSHGTSRAA